jgi:hypothetical protein
MFIGPLVVPALIVIYLAVYHRSEVTKWELGLVFATSIGSVIVGTALGNKYGLGAEEYLTGVIHQSYYYHAYDSHYTDSKGKRHTVHHSPYWQVRDQHGNKTNVSHSCYNSLRDKWGGDSAYGITSPPHSDSWGGVISYVPWDKKLETLQVMTTKNIYENRIRHSHSVFRYQDVSEKEAKEANLFDYPGVSEYKTYHILNKHPSVSTAEAEHNLREWLGWNAGRLQLNVYILIWHNTPYETAVLQERYWQGGNKNEFIICTSLDNDGKVQWSHSISWTPQERLKVDVQNYVRDQKKLNLPDLVKYLETELPKSWVRRDFAEFKYLAVELPWWALLMAYLIPIGVTGGVAIWVVVNEYEESSFGYYGWR